MTVNVLRAGCALEARRHLSPQRRGL